MTKTGKPCNAALLILLVFLLPVSGCGIASSYRATDQKTIRDYDATDTYRKRVGILALTNTTVFTSNQIAGPFLDAFLASLTSAVPDGHLLLPDEGENMSFLISPPRIDNGDMDVFNLSALARQAGLNAVVSPMIIDIRTSKNNSGFWFFRDLTYILQIQTAAAVYDTITGARLSMGILTEKIDISEQQFQMIKGGQETSVADLIEVAQEMGEDLGEQMGEAVEKSRWMASVVSLENGTCGIPAGSDVGIGTGDRFSVLDAGSDLTGLHGQRFIVPGTKIDELTILRVTDRKAFGEPKSGSLPPVGSIVVPDTD